MATLQQQIAEKFLAKLAEAKEVDAAKIEQLRALLAEGR
jgi:predicted transcriptional regulator